MIRNQRICLVLVALIIWKISWVFTAKTATRAPLALLISIYSLFEKSVTVTGHLQEWRALCFQLFEILYPLSKPPFLVLGPMLFHKKHPIVICYFWEMHACTRIYTFRLSWLYWIFLKLFTCHDIRKTWLQVSYFTWWMPALLSAISCIRYSKTFRFKTVIFFGGKYKS